jgi:hypothetical protein
MAEGGENLVYNQGEFRCILVWSASSSVATKMYASLESCDSKRADGVLLVAAAAAPPPPPGATTRSYFDPQHAPPPPPSMTRHAISIYKRETIVPLTEAVCDGKAGEGHVHREICSNFLSKTGKFQLIFGVGIRAVLCSDFCFHSCDGDYVGGQDHDSFDHCKRSECASSSCLDFLLRECPPILNDAINAKYQATCTLAPPSPPAPAPLPLPPPTPSPRPPPPALKYAERFRDAELDEDPDCELVTYDVCQEIIRQFAAQNSGYSTHMLVTTSKCEGIDVESDCFVGCSYGSKTGGTYRFLLEDDDEFTRKRCKMSEHPRCACSNFFSPPPSMFAPPPPTRFTEEWRPVQLPNDRDTSKGAVSAMKQRLVNGRTMDLSLRTGSMHAFQVCSNHSHFHSHLQS